jgi:transposase
MEVEEAVTHFGTCVTTGYHWVHHWNSEGLERLRPRKSPGRAPRLDEEMLRRLKRTLEIRPYWILKEVRKLIKDIFGVDYSDNQVRRVVIGKLGMNYAKPFIHDYRKPKEAEDILFERVDGAINNLRAKGYKDSGIVIGFLDEAAAQNEANAMRVLSFGKPRIFKNTDKIKANAMGYYSLNGKSVISFPQSTRKEKVIEFLRKVRKRNPGKGIIIVMDNYKSHKAGDVMKEAEKLGIELVFLPPYSPDLNPIEYIWKSIKKIISTMFIRHINDMRNVFMEAFYQFCQKLSFAAGWVDKFLQPRYNGLCK